MAYQLTIGLALGSSQTGLTLRANLWPTGGSLGGAVTTGFRELGGGAYDWTGTIPGGFEGSVLFYDDGSGVFKAATSINLADDPATLAAVAAATANLTFDGAAPPNVLAVIPDPAIPDLAAQIAGAVNPVTLAAAQPNYAPARAGDPMGLVDGAITDAKVAMPAEAAGQPAGFLATVRRLLELLPGGNKKVRDRATGLASLRNAADTGNLVQWQQSTTATGPADLTGVDTETRGG